MGVPMGGGDEVMGWLWMVVRPSVRESFWSWFASRTWLRMRVVEAKVSSMRVAARDADDEEGEVVNGREWLWVVVLRVRRLGAFIFILWVGFESCCWVYCVIRGWESVVFLCWR